MTIHRMRVRFHVKDVTVTVNMPDDATEADIDAALEQAADDYDVNELVDGWDGENA